MGKTTIEWADKSLNYYTWSCHKVSEGCKHCYMMDIATRRGLNPVGAPQWRENALKEYQTLKAGEVVFVCSMSDIYHEGIPVAWVQRIHQLAANKPDVIFLHLTKRPRVALAMADLLVWPDNLWLGTSVEMQKYLPRIDTLLQIPAAGHFVSIEPLLEPIPRHKLAPYLLRLKWVIVGAESGPKRRPFEVSWARDIRDACIGAAVPFMYKQGSAFKSGQNRVLDGRTWDETPFAHIADVKAESYQLRMFE